ncbi:MULTISPECIES: hypothetical protein [unclassified Microcoleus]|uniref:hypothetical protein n=1 Tax=unclassified Microcoleus TaxID=2642155 RepID=UPI002FD512B5
MAKVWQFQSTLYNLIFCQEKRVDRALSALLPAKCSASFLYSPTITVKYLYRILKKYSRISLNSSQLDLS